MDQKSIRLGCLCAAVSETIFGCSFLFTKGAAGRVSALTLLSWRFTVAFLAMTVLIALRVLRVRYRGKPLRILFPIALLQPVIYFSCETAGIYLTTAAESGTIIAAIPVVTVFCSALLLRKPPTRRQVSGILIAMAGVAVTVLTQHGRATLNPAGYALLFMAVLAHSLYTVCVSRAGAFTGIELTYAMMAAGAFVFTALAAAAHAAAGTLRTYLTLPLTDSAFLTAVLYLGLFSSVGAFFLCNTAVSLIGTNRTATFAGLAAAVSVLLGVTVLGEPFSAGQFAGVAAILAGVYLSNRQEKDKKSRPAV